MVQDAPHGATIECSNSTQENYAKALAKRYDRPDTRITNKLRPEPPAPEEADEIEGMEWFPTGGTST